jgi:N-acylneuraminate cytidylyltransferase/CMP-N,N'-diacetyllegionaminic acid synthase
MKMGPLLGLIPARGGSKGVPRKNIRSLGGKPLIAYAIEAARIAGCLEGVFVDSDDPEIVHAALQFGAEAPWLRPSEFASDSASVVDAVIHFARRFERERGIVPRAVALLQPTSPLRSGASIKAGVDLFLRGGGESVVSVSPVKEHPHWVRKIDREGILLEYIPGADDPACRQDLPAAFVVDGGIFISTIANLESRRSFFSLRTRAILTPAEESLDIDDAMDWEFAEFLLSRRSNEGRK